MAATRNQVEALAARSVRRMFMSYDDPRCVRNFVRAAVFEAKRVGTPAARDVAKAMLREVYQIVYGEDPANRREFFKWVQHALTGPFPLPSVPVFDADPIGGVDRGDAFGVDETDVIT